MIKRKIEQLEQAIKAKTGRTGYPPAGFFVEGDPAIDTYHETLIRQGWELSAVMKTPIYIEPKKWSE
ncbi:MAG: hypothetical protein FWB73_00915 [Treponema sp.]|nr:hypothetical protein [Treponema sp.]